MLLSSVTEVHHLINMAVYNTDLPYFFDRPKRRCTKRERKPVEKLPFSLPYTGVSGTLKVEAYLRQQLKISESAGKQERQDNSEESGQNTETQNGDGNDKATLSSLQNKTREELDFTKKHSRKERAFADVVHRDRHENDDEEEDTQRFLFEENKFAAPNFLAKLGRLLDWLFEKQKEKMDSPRRSDNNYAGNWANLTSNNVNHSIINFGASHGFDVRALDITVPFHLQEKLKLNFEQLIANAVYTKRAWQTTGYKHQEATREREISGETSGQDNLNNCCKKQDSVVPAGSDKKLRKLQEEQASAKQPETSQNMGKLKDNSASALTQDEPNPEVPTTLLGFRRESAKSNLTGFSMPRTRLEKYKYLPDKGYLVSVGRKRLGTTAATKAKQEAEPEAEKGNEENYDVSTPLTSIAFSLMSKTCEDQGWVNHEGQSGDLERLTVIEWARNRLQEAITSRTECVLKAKERGEDGPLIVRRYGESSGDVTVKLQRKSDDGRLKQSMKSKSTGPVIFKQYGESASVIKARNKEKLRIWRTPSGTAKVDMFMIILPDETMTLYYPSGKMAVCVAKNMVGEGKYTYVYDDDCEDTLIAYFTPTSAYCRGKQGKQFLCTSKKGTIHDKDGVIVREWAWKASKLLPAVLLELNKYFTLRIVSRDVMTLHYSGKQESCKIMVGVTQSEHHVQLNAMGEMMTTGEYHSDAAQQPIIKPKPRNRREERRAKGLRKQSQPVNNEEQQEQRKEELDKKFPERRNLALDLPSDVELYKLKRRIKNIAYEWMEGYRLLVGITSPVKLPSKQARRRQLSAKSLPGALPSSQEILHKLNHVISSHDERAPSAPPIPRGEKFDVSKVKPLERLHSPAEGLKEPGFDWSRDENSGASRIYLTEVDKQRCASRPAFRCGLVKSEPRSSSPKDGCSVALRAEIRGEKYPFCRCRKREIPFVTDVEYDVFIWERVAHTQLLVVSVVSSRHPADTPCTSMLEQLYYEKNRNRSFPCAQARHDPFRIVLYDVDSSLKIDEPLLVKRHNVVPGMFLMYIGGKLLFADHIFNGYGNARKDFLKQINKSRKDFLQSLFLPQDFRLSPTPCRSGLRAAWGGEIGGLSKNVCRTESQITRDSGTPVDGRLSSAVTTDSESTVLRTNGAKSAASFVKLGLSIDSPYSRCVKSKPISSLLSPLRKTAPQSRT